MAREGKLTSTPWEDCGWTKAKYFSFIRSALRQTTVRYPAKQKYLASKCRPAPKGYRAKQLVDCEQCGKTMAKSNAHVDHIIPCGSLNDFDDLERFISTLFCGVENFAVLCDDCNYTWAYADKHGLTFEEAQLEKAAIAKMKEFNVEQQKKYLKRNGFSDKEISNDKKRRECFKKLMLENK